ncbi:MAG: siphovirus ReqiPepy6 Gp37-like family protein [Acetatifactor sp.]|nr:siphovirus ReqiPepy6 Gp37-like family protein [Acetatifactor sp.]
MEIHIYDRNLYRKGTIENHTSLQWNRKYYECGTFELHTPVTDKNLKLLQPGNIITIGDKKEAAVIRGDQTEEESTMVNEIVRNGYFLPVYLGDRLTGPLFNYSGTVEDAMRYMIDRAEEIPLLQIADGIGDQTKIEFQATYKNLLSYMEKLARYAEIGFRVVPDFKRKTMTFETYKGLNRTSKQGKNHHVVFSEGYENLNQAKHNYSDESYTTKVIVGGAGEGKNRIYVTVGGGTGFDLREYFLDAKDISQDGLTNAQYLAALRTRGEEFLAEHGIFENFEAEAEADVNFTYGKDYDLGDIVTVKIKKWGKTQNLRITEICEVYENGGMYVVPTFGDAIPTKINWDD